MLFQILELCIISCNFFTAATALNGVRAKPTNSLQYPQDGAIPPQPTKPPSLAHQALKRDTNVCGIMQNDPAYSDHTYACQSNESCLWNGGWWGCCFTTETLGCSTIICPRATSCVGFQDLPSCDSSCSSAGAILKCTNSQSPFCATATAIQLLDRLTGETSGMSLSTFFRHYECATSPYSLSFTVTAVEAQEPTCAAPWITNPASLSKYSATHTTGTQHTFSSLVDGILAHGQVAPNITTTTVTLQQTITVGSDATITVTSNADITRIKWSLYRMLGILLIAIWLLE